MQQFKNIIFDLGGVLIDIDYNAPVKAFAKLGFSDFESMYSQTGVNKLFEQLETGAITDTHFFDELRKLAPQPYSNDVLRSAWNSILKDWRIESLRFLEELANKYQIFLLSNTNQIHHDAFQSSLHETTGRPKLDGYFIKAWYSHLIHQRKPEISAYEWVLNDGGLKKEETLFIDDSLVNIEAANAMGLPAYLLGKTERIEQLDLLK